MAKKATTDKQSLELIMWNCHNDLCETTGGNEKNYNAVMDLVFLKFGGNKFDKRYKEGFLK
jgi:type I restriction enzyme M protein